MLAETVDRVAIDALQRAYADVVDRRAWADLHHLFLPDATVELDLVTRPGRTLVGPDDFAAFVGPAMARFTFFEFVILNSHVELWPDGDRSAATARLFMCELRAAEGDDGTTARTDAFGLYRDRYAKVDGRWRIAARRYRSLAHFPSADVFPLPDDL